MKFVAIEKRFCGPPKSANGGYVCGLLASYIDGDAEITLLAPPPLGEGPHVRVVDLVAAPELAGGQRSLPDPQVGRLVVDAKRVGGLA